MSVINDVLTNRVCALSVHSYFCLNTAQYIHVVEYSEDCFLGFMSITFCCQHGIKCHREKKKKLYKNCNPYFYSFCQDTIR